MKQIDHVHDYATVISYGIYGGAQSVIEILHQTPLNTHVTFHVIDPLTGIMELPYDQIKKADKKTTIVVIAVGESHGYTEFYQIVDRLVSQCKMPADQVVLYTGCMEDSGPNYNIGTIVPHVNNSFSIPYFKKFAKRTLFYEPTHHFVCLNRAPAWQRAKIVEMILDQNLDQFGAVSYATSLNSQGVKMLGTHPDDQYLFPMKYRDRLPLLVDREKVTIEQGFAIDHDQIKRAFINVITETGYGCHPEMPYERQGIQHASLTEKTYKCFVMGQIPLWLSAMNTVKWARELGFDVFDDIVDHSYDQEPDPAARIPLVAAELSRLCHTHSVDDLQKLHKQLVPRFKKNYQTLKSWAKSHTRDVPRWERYFKHLGLCDD